MKEGLENFIRDVSKEIERLNYNQVIINRSLIHLKKMLDHLHGGRMEEIANFLENYKNENSETEVSVREVDETTESIHQEISR